MSKIKLILPFLILLGCSTSFVMHNVEVKVTRKSFMNQRFTKVKIENALREWLDLSFNRFQELHIDDWEIAEEKIENLTREIENLNMYLPHRYQIRSVIILTGAGNVFYAGYDPTENQIQIPISRFTMFEDEIFFRVYVWHEVGHAYFRSLSPIKQGRFNELWLQCYEQLLFHLFQDGNYYGAAPSDGHPQCDPDEFFASAFNVIHNNLNDFYARKALLTDEQQQTVDQVLKFVYQARGW